MVSKGIAANPQVTINKDERGVAVVLLNSAGKVNLLTSEMMHELGNVLDEALADPEIKSLVLFSGKADHFCLGADLHEIIKMQDETSAYTLSSQGKLVFDKLANSNKPVVVAMNGSCLGGGLELALCAHRRIASLDENTRFGLPEVKLGLIPGLGGTQRLPRLIGLKPALEMILSADSVSAVAAKEMGIVDELVDFKNLKKTAEEAAYKLSQDMPSNLVSPKYVADSKDASVFAMYERSIRIKTKGQYPSYVQAIAVIKEGLSSGLENGLALESKMFAQLAVSPIARNLIFLFFATEFANQSAKASKSDGNKLSKLAVVGAGNMGAAIAFLAASSGHCVLLKEADSERLEQAVERIKAKSLLRANSKSNLLPKSSESVMQEIVPVSGDEDLREADLVIEAVFEDLKIKVDVFRKLESQVKPDCVLASNTSSLPLGQIADQITTNERLLGLHFFHPVERMQLVEVISHSRTSKDALSKGLSFVARLGKTPIAVKDGPGFLVNRLLCCYLLEAARLMDEEVPLNWIEEVAIGFGMPMGPLALLDEVGMDIAFKVVRQLFETLGERFKLPNTLFKVEANNMIGKKNGGGFYLWDDGGRRLSFDPRLTDIMGLVITSDKPNKKESDFICDRLILPMIDEAARCLDEKIVRRAREIDMAMVLGIGFPAFRGGPLRYADSLGMDELKSRLEKIYQMPGSGRQAADLIGQMQSQRRCFYSRVMEKMNA